MRADPQKNRLEVNKGYEGLRQVPGLKRTKILNRALKFVSVGVFIALLEICMLEKIYISKSEKSSKGN